MLGVLAATVLFVAPSTVFWALARRLGPRPDSLVGRASKLSFHRFVIVMVVLAAHVPLVVLMMVQPKDGGPPPPGHQYGPAFESWLAEMVGAALFSTFASTVSWIAVCVVFVRELVLLSQTVRARRRVVRSAEPGSAPENTPMDFDFGVGEEHWAFHGPGRDGYREVRPIEAWARGRPTLWPAALGPLVSILTALAVFGFIGMDMLLSLGD